MKRAMFSMLGVVALLFLAQGDCLACTCSLLLPKLSLKKQVKEALNESQAVFSGKVLEITQNPQTYSVVVKFKVKRSWKGLLPEEIHIVTGRGGGDCGYRFEIGESYLVYAYDSNAYDLNQSGLGTGDFASDHREPKFVTVCRLSGDRRSSERAGETPVSTRF